MTTASGLWLSKVAPSSQPHAPERGGDWVADDFLRQAVRRLEVVAVLTFVFQLGTWLTINLLQGTLVEEFTTWLEWGFPVGVMAASLGVALLARSHRGRRMAATTVLRFGLIYQVIVSVGIAAGSYLGAFEGVAPESITFDRIGLTFVGPWMLMFSVLVPAPPREALFALLGSAAAVPLTYLAQVPSQLAPPLPASAFALVFVVPYLVVVAMSYVAARVVHHLGVEVRRANELGSYRLDALLGSGGMGEVWRASHRMLARPAAIKLIHPKVLGEDRATAAARFAREAQAIASLESPNTVALYDFGSAPDGTLYYVMELLDGVDLEELVRQHGPLPAERVAYILRQVCASLAEAHGRGIIHRDIKPANIYVCRRAMEHDVVKLLDFGLVKQLVPELALADARLTQGDGIAGTPAYLAPEIILGAAVDERADLYALGCVAFWLLTGRLVFEAITAGGLLVAHVREAPRRPSTLASFAVPEALDRLVLDCLAKDPVSRPESAETIAEQLAAIPFLRPWTPAAAEQWWEANRPPVGRR